MAEESIIPKQGVGRTFNVSIWILGTVATLQAAAVAWAIVSRAEVDSGRNTGRTPVAPAPASPGAGVAVMARAGVAPDVAPGPGPGGASAGAGETAGAEPVASVAVAPDLLIETQAFRQIPSHLEIVNPKVIELMEAGESLRKRGDFPGALARYREAETLLPNHPAVLYEIADCFDVMGLREKAVTEWEKIIDLGAERAGDYWMIADLSLRGEASDEPASEAALLTVSNILVQRHPEVTEAEKVTLRIAIKARAGTEIVPENVVVNVFFFDLVNDGEVARTTADQPRYQWATLPIDWNGQPEEILEVEYYHPILTPEQVVDLGHRKYHGHIVEVYYRNELQDVVAQPRTLRSLAPDAASPLLQNRLFPAN